MCTGIHEPDSTQLTVSCQVSEPRRIWGPRLLPAQQRCSAELVGLAIVAAIQAELDAATSSPRANQQVPRHPTRTTNQQMPRHPTTPANQQVPRQPTTARSANQQIPVTRANQQKPRHCVEESTHHKGPSIFTISIPSCLNASSPHFSTSCFLCKRPLPSNKDIYMYRGDQAFCTKQCRHHQMAMDESKEKLRSCTPTFTIPKCHIDSCTAPNYYKHKERIFAHA